MAAQHTIENLQIYLYWVDWMCRVLIKFTPTLKWYCSPTWYHSSLLLLADSCSFKICIFFFSRIWNIHIVDICLRCWAFGKCLLCMVLFLTKSATYLFAQPLFIHPSSQGSHLRWSPTCFWFCRTGRARPRSWSWATTWSATTRTRRCASARLTRTRTCCSPASTAISTAGGPTSPLK